MKKRSKYLVVISVGIVVLIGAIFGYINIFSYKVASEIPYDCERLCFAESNTPKISEVEVSHNFNGVRIKNNSSSGWDCDILAVSGYFSPQMFINPNQSIDIAYDSFTVRNVRLDTDLVKPDNLSLQCTAGGIHQASKFRLN